MMYGWYGGWDLGWWIAMAVMMLIFWGGLAAVVVLIIRGTQRGRGGYEHGPLPHEDPEHILAQRFARGEIDEAEYKARIEALRRRP